MMKRALGWSTLALLAATSPPPIPRTYTSHPVDTAHGDRESILLWPDGAPGALGTEPEDRPKVTVYRASEKSVNGSVPASGAAAVVCPGGGYRRLASDHEGKQVAQWLNSLGVTAVVLQYRVGPRYRHPAPLQDAQRALRLVRSRAADLHVDPSRVGIVGFSAGGHLAAWTATEPGSGRPDAPVPVDRLDARPDFAILGYPVISLAGPFVHTGSRDHLLGDPADPAEATRLSAERRVTPRTPPTFLFHTADDPSVPVENSLAFHRALREAGVPAELHVFPTGPHGVGLAPGHPVLSQWPSLAAAWLRSLGMLDRAAEAGPGPR